MAAAAPIGAITTTVHSAVHSAVHSTGGMGAFSGASEAFHPAGLDRQGFGPSALPYGVEHHPGVGGVYPGTPLGDWAVPVGPSMHHGMPYSGAMGALGHMGHMGHMPGMGPAMAHMPPMPIFPHGPHGVGLMGHGGPLAHGFGPGGAMAHAMQLQQAQAQAQAQAGRMAGLPYDPSAGMHWYYPGMDG